MPLAATRLKFPGGAEFAVRVNSNKDGAVSLGELQRYVYAQGTRINVGSSDSPYHQLSVAYPADSGYVLFVRK